MSSFEELQQQTKELETELEKVATTAFKVGLKEWLEAHPTVDSVQIVCGYIFDDEGKYPLTVWGYYGENEDELPLSAFVRGEDTIVRVLGLTPENEEDAVEYSRDYLLEKCNG